MTTLPSTSGASTRVQLPILPLRNSVLFPSVVMPLAVGRPRSLRLVKHLHDHPGNVAVLTQRSSDVEEPGEGDLYDVATEARIVKTVRIGDDNYSVIVQGERRLRFETLLQAEPFLMGEFSVVEEADERDVETDALLLNLKQVAKQVIKYIPEMPREFANLIDQVDEPVRLGDFVTAHMDLPVEEKQRLLAELSLRERLREIIVVLTRQLEVAKVSAQIQSRIKEEVDRNQREYYLRQQYKAIKEQLGEIDGDGGELDDLESRIDAKEMPDEVEKVVRKQFHRLQQMQPASSEYGVTRTYIETLLDIPWTEATEDNLDIEHAKTILDAEHFGLDKVKERLVEFLAVRKLRADMKGPILCLIGPPGVGKTSLGKSVAKALGREFVRISLGGVHDEAEIRGHRRTYVGALPGRVVQALRKAKTRNPVLMLDEIDKVGRDFRGDPQSALLEVLDPEQNHTFSDHYVEIPVDLSSVLFIANANQMDTISPPLRDRMEVIDIPGYTPSDKFAIVQQFMLPKQLENHGITEEHVRFEDDAVRTIIDRYTREAGVRNLERRVADVCRKIAVRVATAAPEEPWTITAANVSEFLGPEKYEHEVAERVSDPGIATGLAWTPFGGDILFIEAVRSEGKGELKLTGQLGDVMKESAMAALSYLKMRATTFGLPVDFLRHQDVHLHFPAGAVPKDGPSAGITIFTTLLSLFTGIKVRDDVAMTGEITLRGNVLPVGGIKEKALAAHRAGIKRVLLPEKNRKDLVDVAKEVLDELEFVFVRTVAEIPKLALVEEPQPLAVIPAPEGTMPRAEA